MGTHTELPDNELEMLWGIRRAKQDQYCVRTRFIDRQGQPEYINHLIREQSPYLLQHAHNPVHWRGWNEETFTLAKQLNKPIFLSIGYSTCHWCHVMEEESFDNTDVAAVLNDLFIPIKVDREQRPDLDDIYMTAVQIVSGQGGWPMSTFLTPDGDPFFGGTYFQRAQFILLLQRIGQLWAEEQSQLIEQSRQLRLTISRYLVPSAAEAALSPMEDRQKGEGQEKEGQKKEGMKGVVQKVAGKELISQAREQLLQMADRSFGGFGEAPKFPQEANLLFLIDQVSRDQRPLADIPEWAVVRQTLDAMLQGGIYDQIGGGFHRYAVDRQWRVPHFENMLYNQSQLTRVYTQAYQLCGYAEYQRIVQETLTYVLREMRNEDGLFYSATDADSDGEEGRFFVWSYKELKQALTAEDWQLCKQVYGITRSGNFEGASIPLLGSSLPEQAKQLGISYPQLCEHLNSIKSQLYLIRQKRVPPLTDDKIITEWNGMMIAALAEAARVFNQPAWLQASILAAEKIWQQHRQPDGSLWRLSMDRVGAEQALLEDYAHLTEGLLQIYDANHDHIWLERAEALLTTLKQQYWDQDNGGFYTSSPKTHGPLLVRSKCLADNATICGNSQMLSTLAALYQRTGDLLITTTTNEHVRAFTQGVSQHPLSALYFLRGMAELEQPNPTGLQYSTAGQVWCSLAQSDTTDNGWLELSLKIHMSEGWHIQSHQCKTGDGQCTSVSLLSDAEHECLDVRYPTPKPWQMTDGQPLEVYADECEINLTIKPDSKAPVRLELQLQACNETYCHQPHCLSFSLWPW